MRILWHFFFLWLNLFGMGEVTSVEESSSNKELDKHMMCTLWRSICQSCMVDPLLAYESHMSLATENCKSITLIDTQPSQLHRICAQGFVCKYNDDGKYSRPHYSTHFHTKMGIIMWCSQYLTFMMQVTSCKFYWTVINVHLKHFQPRGRKWICRNDMTNITWVTHYFQACWSILW